MLPLDARVVRFFFFSSRRRHTRSLCDWSSDVCSSDLGDLSLADVATKLTALYSDLDILINNLGIFEPKPFVEITDQEWMHFFEVNVLSGVRLARFYLPRMLKKDWGRIIFISSESALPIPAEMIHYGTTKTAQIAVSRGLAELTAGSVF